MWCPLTGWANACDVLKQNNLQPIELSYKEGLALINGTQLVSSIGALGLEKNTFLKIKLFIKSCCSCRKISKTSRCYCSTNFRCFKRNNKSF